MKYFLVVVMMLAPVFGQSKGITVSYDRFKDQTRIETARLSLPLVGVRDTSATVKAIVLHPGAGRAATAAVALSFEVFSRYGYKFDTETTLILILDGERVTVEHVNCHGFLNAGPYIESAWAPISLETLKKLATARTAEGQLGSVEFKVPAERQKAIAALVSYFP